MTETRPVEQYLKRAKEFNRKMREASIGSHLESDSRQMLVAHCKRALDLARTPQECLAVLRIAPEGSSVSDRAQRMYEQFVTGELAGTISGTALRMAEAN